MLANSLGTNLQQMALAAIHWSAAVAVVGCMWAGAGTAWAQAPSPGGTLLVLEGDADRLSPSEKAELQRTIDAEVQARPAWNMLPKPQESIIDLMFDAECLEPDDACLKLLGEGRSATAVLFYEAQPDGSGFGVSLRLIDVATGAAPVERALKGASLAAALGQLASAFDSLLGNKPPPKPKMVGLRVRSNPAAATVTLNGEEIGVTPVEVRKPAGPYTMRVSREGYETVERKLELRDKDLDFELILSQRRDVTAAAVVADTPASGTETPGDEIGAAFYETWWFWTAVGVGVVGASVGIAAAAGAFSDGAPSTGGLTFQLGARPDQDVLIQGQFK